jgi:hypothetical protein
MKRTTRRRKLSSELTKKRGLRLAQETVRVLTSDELTKAASGCPTDSLTTERQAAPTLICG